MKVYTISR
jgi:hypothetical protein